jgi:MoaA/NifB/PqqE/SkfB family radical SAM enzyme
MCTRNIHGGIENPNIKKNGWTLAQYKQILNEEVCKQIKKIMFCGNYGDPLLNKHLPDMVEHTLSINPSIEIRIHTNGSLRNTEWWEKLAESMNDKSSVIFAIDGLEDTHSLYRIGTDYNKIIENAKAFIKAGGNASWAYIRFKHNQHQVDHAKKIAKELGFFEFSLKDSSRWVLEANFPVLDSSGEVVYNLEPSDYSDIKIIDESIIKNYKNILENTEISCHAKHMREVYVDANCHVFPCCWIAMIPYHPPETNQSIIEIRNKINQEYWKIVNDFGGRKNLNATNKSLKDIINSKEYQSLWEKYWEEKSIITCARMCGKVKNLYSKPNDQFVETKNFYE